MSVMSIAAYFPFRRVCLFGQSINLDGSMARVDIRPDRRFRPVCHVCGRPASSIHAWEKRSVRDLNMGSIHVWLNCSYRKVVCSECDRIQVEDLGVFEPYKRVTRRLARYIHELCKVMTVEDVARHLDLDWKTVKDIDRSFLDERYAKTDYEGLRILAVDEISVRKRFRFMTVVSDYETGRVVWMGKDRKIKTLKRFFNGMTKAQRMKLQAIAMDMWDPYIRAVRDKVPHVKIVFDLFHVVSLFGKVIDRVRIDEHKKASEKDKDIFKGARFLLLKNRKNIRRQKHREQLKELLAINESITSVMILKDKLKHIWAYKNRTWARKAIKEWCDMARTIGHPDVDRFAKMLERYQYGILNHCDYPIHTGRLEGINNKIKVIKRKAYGFHDDRYFQLKILQAFDSKLTN